MKRRNAAFSLVEISVVLATIGLLAGGILTGRNLMRGAEVNSVVTDFQRYEGAVNQFKTQYSALPGDMPNATQYWGAQSASYSSCYMTVSTSELTCNGNGNGNIDQNAEMFRGWQHLSNGGYVTGSFTGTPHNTDGGYATIASVPGKNIPPGKAPESGYVLIGADSTAVSNGTAVPFPSILFGRQAPNALPQRAVLKTDESLSIDQKIDDGKPNSGVIVAYQSSDTPNCNSATTYTLGYKDKACSVAYKLAKNIPGGIGNLNGVPNPTAPGPTSAIPVEGVCAATYNTCTAGTASNANPGVCGGTKTWKCLGTLGAASANCSLANPVCPTHGACGGSANTCSAGTPSGYSDSGCDGSKSWTCLGANGGNNAPCSIANEACEPDPGPAPGPSPCGVYYTSCGGNLWQFCTCYGCFGPCVDLNG